MKAVVYAFVSGWGQAEALQRQGAAGTLRARELGADDVQVLEDSFGAASLERPAMSRLRDMVRSGEVDLVVASGADALSRDAHDLSTLKRELEEHHVTLALLAG